MIKLQKYGSSTYWMTAISAGIAACLIGVVYTFFKIQQEAGDQGDYQQLANELRLVSQTVVSASAESAQGRKETFEQLSKALIDFDRLMSDLQDLGLSGEVASVRSSWLPMQSSSQTLIEAGPRIVLIHGVSDELEQNIRPIQSEFATAIDIIRDERMSADTVAAAQKTLWLTERIARNIDKILAGGAGSQQAADEFRTDTADFGRIVNALKDGSAVMGVQRLRDPDALSAINAGSRAFSVVSTSIDQIAESSAEMRKAANARQAIVDANNDLLASVAALVPAIDRLINARMYDRGTLMVLFGAPALLAVGLLVLMYRSQRQRVVDTENGVAAINGALEKIAEGDLTVEVPEDNTVTRDIARQINASTDRQRELIRNIRTPFRVSVDEINKIGRSAHEQVEKGKELTRSVAESTTAANDMVDTSEEIKTATAEAAQTSEQNREQVAAGYELTKDMSQASANVREAVQETSKSAKRQGELIQSVTTAAEYIQALNTKISVVAINTRIEAEKAGEHGRPFLGIAEAIGDLLREAEEEGRKIISEVRMLQNMSADNLASMENTVGNVVNILEYIEQLEQSLEGINAGSAAITDIINSVDRGAGHSADNAQHMNVSMAQISERNLDISEYSVYTQEGVGSLQRSMREVAENLSQFKIEHDAFMAGKKSSELDSLEPIREAGKVYDELQMTAMESSEKTTGKASV
ncbi:MAG: methyl-accepting chemotaxis protein [Pseudomonadota bacterium]